MLYKSPEILRNTRTHSDLNTTGGENSIIVRSSGARDHQGAGTVPEDREMGRGAGGGGGIHTAAEIKIDRVEERKMYNRKKRKPVQSQALTL